MDKINKSRADERNRRALRGAMLGLAIGDALGATLEFMRREDVRRQYPDGLRDLIGGGAFGWVPGQTTDDTAMALAVLKGALKAGADASAEQVVDAIGAEFVAWADSGPPDIGTTCLIAIQAYRFTGSWQRAALTVRQRLGEQSAGNGALMRTLPVTFLWPDDPRRMLLMSWAIAHMSHPHPDVLWTAGVYNLYAGILAREGLKAGPGQWEAALAEYARLAPGVEMDAVIPLDDARGRRADLSDRFSYERIVQLGEKHVRPTGYCVDTLEAALWALWTTKSLEECIVKAANLGGDADTVAAVAGGLAGAAYGEQAVPARWLNGLETATQAEIAALAGA